MLVWSEYSNKHTLITLGLPCQEVARNCIQSLSLNHHNIIVSFHLKICEKLHEAEQCVVRWYNMQCVVRWYNMQCVVR